MSEYSFKGENPEDYEAEESSGGFDGEESTGQDDATKTVIIENEEIAMPIPPEKPKLPKSVGIGYDTAAFTGTTDSAVKPTVLLSDQAKERSERIKPSIMASRSRKTNAQDGTPEPVVEPDNKPDDNPDEKPVDGTVIEKTVSPEPVNEAVVVAVVATASPAIVEQKKSVTEVAKPAETLISPHDVAYDKVANPVALAKMASRYGIKPDDPMWEAFLLVIEAQASRDTAISVLDTATKLVNDLPKQIESKITQQIKGLATALDEASQKVATDRATAIQKLIDASVESGVQQMTDVTSNLNDKIGVSLAKMDSIIQSKVDNGIQMFADSAALASVSAVKAASSRVMVRSYIGALIIIVLAGLTGFGGAEFANYYSLHSQMALNSKALIGSYTQQMRRPNNGG